MRSAVLAPPARNVSVSVGPAASAAAAGVAARAGGVFADIVALGAVVLVVPLVILGIGVPLALGVRLVLAVVHLF